MLWDQARLALSKGPQWWWTMNDDIDRDQKAERDGMTETTDEKLDRLIVYVRGLRDAIGALAERLTGDQLGIVITDDNGENERRWAPNTDNIVWLRPTAEGFRFSPHSSTARSDGGRFVGRHKSPAGGPPRK